MFKRYARPDGGWPTFTFFVEVGICAAGAAVFYLWLTPLIDLHAHLFKRYTRPDKRKPDARLRRSHLYKKRKGGPATNIGR